MAETIKTNNQPRELMCLSDFPLERQQQLRFDFDWADDLEDGCSLFSYKGTIYHLSNFLRVNAEKGTDFYGWHGAEADSYFTGTLVKITDDNQIIVGRYLSA